MNRLRVSRTPGGYVAHPVTLALGITLALAVLVWFRWVVSSTDVDTLPSPLAQGTGLSINQNALTIRTGVTYGLMLCFTDAVTGAGDCRSFREVEDFVLSRGSYRLVPRHELYPDGARLVQEVR